MNWKSDVEELKLRNKLAKSQGGTEAIKLQHAKGRLTLRERIDLLSVSYTHLTLPTKRIV